MSLVDQEKKKKVTNTKMRDGDGVLGVLGTDVVRGSGSELGKHLHLAEDPLGLDGEIGSEVTVGKTPVCYPDPRLHRLVVRVRILVCCSHDRRRVWIQLNERCLITK